jgi:hypothetical protein
MNILLHIIYFNIYKAVLNTLQTYEKNSVNLS